MKIIEVVVDSNYLDTVTQIAEEKGAKDCWHAPQGNDERQTVRLLVAPEQRQEILDALQNALGARESTLILVIPVEAALSHEGEEKKEDKKDSTGALTTREELYNSVEKNARLTTTFLLLVFLSTVVVAIGLLKDNVAVVIGAMVIAPLLGPNIALALGTALGDTDLMWKALKTTLAGMSTALALTVMIGLVWPIDSFESHELLARTEVGLDSVALALASGAAAVLSLTTGLPSVLVGVMVAVALLPPTAALGLMLGAGKMQLAMGAALLLAVNIVCVNLAAKVAFLIQGIKPRTWLEKQKAKQSMTTYILIWVVSLIILMVAIFFRPQISQHF